GVGRPSLSSVVPRSTVSQPNCQCMKVGDNWIGSVVSSIMNGPDWNSTAIFITYDDFGGFYDHVAPPLHLGLRVPMVIVSPFAKRGFTDSRNASFASILAFVERNFGLTSLGAADSRAYAYGHAFDYSQSP